MHVVFGGLYIWCILHLVHFALWGTARGRRRILERHAARHSLATLFEILVCGMLFGRVLGRISIGFGLVLGLAKPLDDLQMQMRKSIQKSSTILKLWPKILQNPSKI